MTDRLAMGDRKIGLVRISNISKLQPLADDRVSIFIDSKEVYKYIARFISQVTGNVRLLVAGRSVQGCVVISKCMI